MPRQPYQKPNMSPKQRDFIEWLVAPKGLRGHATQNEWGKANQVSPTTLTKWRRDPEFRRAWDERLTELQVDPENIDAVMNALIGKAKAGDTKAIGMYLEIADRYRPKVEVEVTRTELADLDDDALEQLLTAHVQDELAARRDAAS